MLQQNGVGERWRADPTGEGPPIQIALPFQALLHK
jgi:hypothetical protein